MGDVLAWDTGRASDAYSPIIESIIHKTCWNFWITQPLMTLSNLIWCLDTIPIGGFPKILRYT